MHPYASSEGDSDALTPPSSSANTSADLLPHQLASDSDDPSFDFTRVTTSTPRKAGTRSSRRGEGEEEELRASDTESLGGGLELDEDELERGLRARIGGQGGQGGKLTQRSLLQLSGGGRSFKQGAATAVRNVVRGEMHAPSPSTGSSTLVNTDREEDVFLPLREKSDATLRGHFSARQTTTVREEQEHEGEEADLSQEGEDEEEEDQRTVLPPFSSSRAAGEASEDGSSSSPVRQPRRSRIGNLASYVDAKMSASASSSTPRRSPKTRRQLPSSSSLPALPSFAPPPPGTPAAPGAYPPSARKPLPSAYSRTALSSSHPPPPTSRFSPTAQIHDAFSRLITGPDGALSHAHQRVSHSSSSQHQHTFVPSSSLPVERRSKRRTAEEKAQGREREKEREPSKLEKALRQLSQAQREAGRNADFLPPPHEEEEHEEREKGREDMGGAGQRSALEFAMARSFAAQEDDDEEDLVDARRDQAERDARYLAVEHAQSSSSAAEESLSDDQDLRQSALRRSSASVRFASPPQQQSSFRAPSPRSPSPSPPRTAPTRFSPSRQHPPRPTTPPLPALPDLPPPIFPESPEPASRIRQRAHGRAGGGGGVERSSSFLLRRSQSFDAARLAAEKGREERQEQERLERVEEANSRKSPRRSMGSSGSRAAMAVGPSPPRHSSSSFSTAQGRPSPPRPTAALAPDDLRRSSPSSSSAPYSSPPPPESPSSAGEQDVDTSLPHLVSQLSSAVRALAAAHIAPSSSSAVSPPSGKLDARGLPAAPAREEGEDGLGRELARRRKESDRRRREMESELKELEAGGKTSQSRRADLLQQLTDTYVQEQELGFKMDELRKSVEEMGEFLGGQVAQAVGETLKEDTGRRARWFAWVIAIQLLLFLLFLRLANQHASSLFETLYHDPFDPPALFHLPPLSSISSSAPYHGRLSPETLAALSPYPVVASTVSSSSSSTSPLWIVLAWMKRAVEAAVTRSGSAYSTPATAAGSAFVGVPS
ncbi:hypothetical protein JCM8547_006298 [Rhodosporidiobolus lusitaniae]